MPLVLKYSKKREKAICKVAGRYIAQGKIIAYPTDTVYGLGCDAQNKTAVGKIFKIKKRPRAQPLSILVSDFKMLERFTRLNKKEKGFARAKLPGKFTLIFSHRKKLPVSKGKIGFRIPKHWCAKIAKEFGGPITTTSANIHGKPTPGRVSELAEIFGRKVDLYVDGWRLNGKASKVIDFSERKILRN